VRVDHAADVGRKCREGVDEVAELAGIDAVRHRQREEIDELFSCVTHDMRADDLLGLLLDEDLRPCGRLPEGSGREPAEHVVALDLDADAVFLGRFLGQADAGERRDGKDA
jgi:hypothetical protein